MPTMLMVSKLIRADVLDTFGLDVPVCVSQVSQIRHITKLHVHERIRSLRFLMTHHRYKPNSMERVLARMPPLSEMTICAAITQRYVNDARLTVFKERMKMAHEPDPHLANLFRRRTPHCSIITAFAVDPWCRHLLRGRSALPQRPHIKLFAEIERRPWNDPPRPDVLEPVPEPVSATTLFLRDIGLLSSPPRFPRQEWEFPDEAVRYDSRGGLRLPLADPRFVTVVGRMSLYRWIMHWELDGEPFARPLGQEKFSGYDD